MAVYLKDGRRCPAFFTSGVASDGSGKPSTAAYFYLSSEGDPDPKVKGTNSIAEVPDDDGASWTPQDFPNAAHLYVIVPDDANLQEVSDRLERAENNQKRCQAALRGE